MYTQAGAGSAVPCDHADLNFGRRNNREAPEHGGRAVTYEGTIAAREHGCRFARSRYWDGVADEKNSAVQAMERPATHPSPDRGTAEAEGMQLPGGDDAQLAPPDQGHNAITESLRSAPGVQKVTKLGRRDDLGDISTPSDTFSPTSSYGVGRRQLCTG